MRLFHVSVAEVGVRERERVGMSHAVKGFADVGHTPPTIVGVTVEAKVTLM